MLLLRRAMVFSLAVACCLAMPAAAQVEIQVNNTAATTDDYVNWGPTSARARRTTTGSAMTVVLTNSAAGVGKVRFASSVPAGGTATAATLTLSLPGNGAFVPFVVAGQFGSPSATDKDAVIQARNGTAAGALVGSRTLMVRVRKNANTLTAAERNRFLTALRTLNTSGRYLPYQQVHKLQIPNQGFRDAHNAPAFLAWHRSYILRLERDLQSVDPSVSLPFWRFDQAAPNVFHVDFMGVTNPSPSTNTVVTFASTNPLLTWSIEGLSGIRRRPQFAPAAIPPNVNTQDQTLALGTIYSLFRGMEGNPHGSAHNEGGGAGWLSSLATAVRDPLFFMLHSNVDRLWARWQWVNSRFSTTATASYAPLGTFPGSGSTPIGSYINDTMWPWNGVTAAPRPSTAPAGPFPPSTTYPNTPPTQPRPFNNIDYRTNPPGNFAGMGFSYADVPFV
ncbi:MAG TPA: tyrosinase family protein [Thermoanaerobaculia bacterium]|jgi:tyrosinase